MPMWARMSEASLSYAPSDAAWAILAPLLEPPTRRGRSRVPERRLVLDAVLHVLRGGLAWRLSTSRRGGASTTNSGAGDGAASGSGSTTPCASGRASWQAEHHVRRRRSSTARPSGPARLAVSAAATAASGSAAASGTSWSIPEALFCALGCTPPMRTTVARPSRWVWAPVDRPSPTLPAGFHVLPKRWIAERTSAWRGRHRRLAKDRERLAAPPRPGSISP